MTKRRERRVSADSDQRNRKKAEQPKTGETSSNRHILRPFIIFFFLTVLPLALYRLKYSSSHTNTAVSVYERGLVKPNIAFQQILTENTKVSENTSFRHFTHPVLGYVTPWNSKGYEMAKRFNSKFTHISPVWYELKSEGTKLILEGRHNADVGWISELRTHGDALVLPRVVLEAFPNEMLRKKKQWDKAIDLIITECKDMGYDGIVLESWSRWAAYGVLHDAGMRSMALQFIKQLGQALHSVISESNPDRRLQFVYVIPAPRLENPGEHDFGPVDFQQLTDAVDGFSLMTYDFSGRHSPGPNAPLNWIRSSLQMILGNDNNAVQSHSHKIFLGINFYGNDFVISEGLGVGAITGRDYLLLLEKHRPVFRWNENAAEHFSFTQTTI